MQSICIFSKIIRFFVAFVVAVSLFCFESYADDCVLGTDGCAPEFTVTTTELSAGTTFSFKISAAGTYYIDWGDGGAIEPIVKGTVGEQTITHTYTNAGQYTIGMSGQATLYSTGNTTAAISFMNNTNISGISGSLGAIFGTLTDRVISDGTLMSDAQPRFYNTFNNCSNLSGLIPENLFAGISGAPASYMFCDTFYYCRGLSGSIPENLFAGISGAPASHMFSGTFANCTGLSGSIPENLFAGISGTPASNMFRTTFYYCRGLSGYVPANLFAGIDKTTTASNQMYYVFNATGLATSCPASTYQYLTGFESYFSNKVACEICPSDYPNSDAGATSENECYRKCTTDDVAGVHSVMGNNYYGTGVDTCQEAVYYISAGEYLPVGGEEPADCPSGYYCPGVGDVRWDEKNDQGLVLCPSDYPNSDSGAKSENDCYKQCTTDDVVGAMTVVGKNYYGTGIDTCEPTSCVAGWGVKNFVNQIGTEYGLNSAYISTNSQSYGRFYEENFEGDGPKGQAYYGITDLGTFAVDYGKNGVITGRGRCSTKPGVFDYDYDTEVLKELTVRDELYDETGQSGANYCYCQVDSYTPVGELTQVLSDMPWVFEGEFWSEFACNDHCARNCAGDLRANDTYFQEFRSAVFGEPNVCVQESYRMKVGIYLPAGASDAVICPSGSYCPGADSVIKNSNKNQGISECPTEYPYSDAGAVSASNCYKPCTTDDVVNSVSVTGRNYYGDGYDSCAATQCLADWKLQDLYGIVGNTEGINSAHISTNSSSYGEFVEYAEPLYGQDYYGISEPGTFGVSYGDIGVITGRGRCSTKSGVGGVNPTRFKELDDESGVGGANYCYCQVDSYTPVGGLTQVLYDMPWVFKEEFWSESSCSEYCAQSCAGALKPAYEEVLAFRSAVFGYASCDEEVYRVKPGNYLPEREESPSECPSGSFCSGTTGVSSRPDKSQGISGCPSEYPYSDAGAKTKSQCYRDCTGDDVANAMTAVGRNYYGDGVDTCIATDCVSGWHLKPGINLEELVGSTYEGSNSEYMAGTNSAYINNAGEFIEYDMYDENHSQDYYGISEKNSFAVGYGEKGIITGRARCSEMSDEKLDEITDEFGAEGVENCYCRIDSYVSADGIKQSISAPWLYLEWLGWDGPETCTDYCVEYCASNMREHMTLDFRGKMFDAAYELPVCSVNQININWNLGYGDNNVSTTTCFYTDVIEYPTDPVRPGYTFTGWKLVE